MQLLLLLLLAAAARKRMKPKGGREGGLDEDRGWKNSAIIHRSKQVRIEEGPPPPLAFRRKFRGTPHPFADCLKKFKKMTNIAENGPKTYK
jgi:hypothetical protein